MTKNIHISQSVEFQVVPEAITAILKGGLTVTEIAVYGVETNAHVLRRPAHMDPLVSVH